MILIKYMMCDNITCKGLTEVRRKFLNRETNNKQGTTNFHC
ncbi:MAG: hypothetical protein RI894_360 [Bacteroidota bacterium]|jgi:hypothetical protein